MSFEQPQALICTKSITAETMKTATSTKKLIIVLAATFGFVLLTSTAFAHCDTIDGPVVGAARKALAAGDVNLVLIWVHKDDEAEIRKAF